MHYGNLVFSRENFVMIKYYREMIEMFEDYAHKNTLDILEDNMSTALIADSAIVPEDIVQIYSTIDVSTKSGWRETFQLVPPYEENIKNSKISVVATLGASIIGLSEGDTLTYGLPGNIMMLTIEKVTQPRKRIKYDIPDGAFEKFLPKHYENPLTLNI